MSMPLKVKDSDKIPKHQLKLTRRFSEAARPPTPPNASHLVRESPLEHLIPRLSAANFW